MNERLPSFAHHYAKPLKLLVHVPPLPTIHFMKPQVEFPSQHSLAGPNSLCPSQMSTEAHLAELGRILAAGVLRLRHKSSTLSASTGESSLAILPTRSVSRPRARARIGGQ
jgi:hypothetical protein